MKILRTYNDIKRACSIGWSPDKEKIEEIKKVVPENMEVYPLDEYIKDIENFIKFSFSISRKSLILSKFIDIPTGLFNMYLNNELYVVETQFGYVVIENKEDEKLWKAEK